VARVGLGVPKLKNNNLKWKKYSLKFKLQTPIKAATMINFIIIRYLEIT